MRSEFAASLPRAVKNHLLPPALLYDSGSLCVSLDRHDRVSAAVAFHSRTRLSIANEIEKAIDFELPDEEEKAWRLHEQLGQGPMVLVFYRGDW